MAACPWTLATVVRDPHPACLPSTHSAQLRQLVTALSAQPVFFWINQRKHLWSGSVLFFRGVSEAFTGSNAGRLASSHQPPRSARVSLSAGLGAARRTAAQEHWFPNVY